MIGTVVPNDPVKTEIEDANFETVMVDLMKDDDAEICSCYGFKIRKH